LFQKNRSKINKLTAQLENMHIKLTNREQKRSKKQKTTERKKIHRTM